VKSGHLVIGRQRNLPIPHPDRRADSRDMTSFAIYLTFTLTITLNVSKIHHCLWLNILTLMGTKIPPYYKKQKWQRITYSRQFPYCIQNQTNSEGWLSVREIPLVVNKQDEALQRGRHVESLRVNFPVFKTSIMEGCARDDANTQWFTQVGIDLLCAMSKMSAK